MAAEQRLWTGPPGAALRDRLVDELGPAPGCLWIVPTPLARDQLTCKLMLTSRATQPVAGPQVYCWSDLWRMVRREADDGPAWLSEAAARSAFHEAIRRAREAGRLEAIEAASQWPGYQRRLRERFRAWAASEQPLKARAAAAGSAAAAEWAVFVAYRGLLDELGADDDAGMSVWASKRLARSPRFWAASKRDDEMVFLDFDHTEPAYWRILEKALQAGRPVHVTLAYEHDPEKAEVSLATERVRARLIDLGLVETTLDLPVDRPAGLRSVQQALFRTSDHATQASVIEETQGLSVRGAPRGEGISKLVASEVRDLLAAGVPPEEILVVFREWSDEAESVLETLRSWGLPAHADVSRAIKAAPAVSALRLAIRLPLEDWETELIVSLLRHGQFCPPWPDADRRALATAARAIKATLVFRGRGQLLLGLDRALAQAAAEEDEVARERLGLARAVAERLFKVLINLDQSRPWPLQVAELRQVAMLLGIGAADPAGLDPLWDALGDVSDVLDRAGRGGQRWSWAEFALEIDAIVREISVPAAGPSHGSIRLATADQATGARAPYVILADLGEGSFPARSAVEPFLALGPFADPDLGGRRVFAQEMLRFSQIIGSADDRLILVYPTTDLKGQDLLRAGFLEDLLQLLTPRALASCHRSYRRLDPALLDQPELAGTPADHRVRALALASQRGEFEPLGRLAAEPLHRQVLDAAAAAIHIQRLRARGMPFCEYEGLLKDGAAVLAVNTEFGSGYCFSASQLETYIGCPFKFYSKHVLKLKPLDERDELDEDDTDRGSKIHQALDDFEQLHDQRPAGSDLDQFISAVMDRVLGAEYSDATDLVLGLKEIERGRLRRTMSHYVRQRYDYVQAGDLQGTPHRFELIFGEENSDYPMLELAQQGRKINLRGRIDRIDLVQTPDGPAFRVIDYKSGSVPTSTAVKHGEMVQLPLYAMAVQQLVCGDEVVGLFDMGYWSLRDEGFKPITFENWEADQAVLVAHVLALVDQLRRGNFVVQSRTPGCERFCEYRGVCRVRQVRSAEKNHSLNLPTLSARAGRGRRKVAFRPGSVGPDSDLEPGAGSRRGPVS